MSALNRRTRAIRTLATACAVAGCLALIVAVPEFLPRPFLGLGDSSRPPFRFSIDSQRAGLSWYPPAAFRQPWAGQTNRFGVRYNVYTFEGKELSVPTWYLAVVAAFGWAAATLWARRSGQHLAGRCQHCDYDLTGNESGICPECGSPNVDASTHARDKR
jgi:hypothetical protein